jgi:hypothetical protein
MFDHKSPPFPQKAQKGQGTLRNSGQPSRSFVGGRNERRLRWRRKAFGAGNWIGSQDATERHGSKDPPLQYGQKIAYAEEFGGFG